MGFMENWLTKGMTDDVGFWQLAGNELYWRELLNRFSAA